MRAASIRPADGIRAAFIRGLCLFEGCVYLRAASISGNTVLTIVYTVVMAFETCILTFGLNL